jgi:N-acetylglutamate synthase-like GNAT family acetyltransferase
MLGRAQGERGNMIEKACPDNAKEILLVINTSNREAYKNIIPKEYFREPVLSLEKLLEDFERMTFYIYESEGRIVGVAALQIESDEVGRIHWVYILPEHQRRGIGTALVVHLEQKAREIGLRRLRLLTVGKANWAVNFYKKLGYNLADKIERPWGFDVFMEKELELPHNRMLPEDIQPQNDKRSLLRHALATASIYGVCGCGPSGPAPTFAGLNLSNGGAVRRNPPAVFPPQRERV